MGNASLRERPNFYLAALCASGTLHVSLMHVSLMCVSILHSMMHISMKHVSKMHISDACINGVESLTLV